MIGFHHVIQLVEIGEQPGFLGRITDASISRLSNLEMVLAKKSTKSEKMNRCFPGLTLLFSIPLLLIGVLSFDGFVWAHGGHGKAEAQFKVVPKHIENPNETLIKIGDVHATRQDFFNYIRNIAAFQMKADLLQRDFLLHFWVIEGIARYFPTDINVLMQSLVDMGPQWPERTKRMNDWVEKQAGLFARLLIYREKAISAGMNKNPDTRWVLECFSKHIKADFIEEMVLLSAIPSSFQGVRDFVGGLQPAERRLIEKHYKDPDTVGPVARKRLSRRWIQYRRDLMKNTKNERLFENMDSIDVSLDTVIAVVNKHRITLAQFLAIYGPVQNDVHWNSIKRSRCSKLMLAYAMADEVDNLRILPQRFQDKIDLSEVFYLAVEQIVKDFGPATLRIKNPQIDFQFYREICAYLNLMRLEKIFVEETLNQPEYKDVRIDKTYLKKIVWDITTAYTPEQTSYF